MTLQIDISAPEAKITNVRLMLPHQEVVPSPNADSGLCIVNGTVVKQGMTAPIVECSFQKAMMFEKGCVYLLADVFDDYQDGVIKRIDPHHLGIYNGKGFVCWDMDGKVMTLDTTANLSKWKVTPV